MNPSSADTHPFINICIASSLYFFLCNIYVKFMFLKNTYLDFLLLIILLFLYYYYSVFLI